MRRNFAETGLDILEPDRFCEMEVESRIACALLVAVLSVSRERDKGAAELFLAKPAGDLIAVQIGKSDIENYSVRIELYAPFDGFERRIRHSGVLSAKREEFAERVRRVAVIIHDKDTERILVSCSVLAFGRPGSAARGRRRASGEADDKFGTEALARALRLHATSLH